MIDAQYELMRYKRATERLEKAQEKLATMQYDSIGSGIRLFCSAGSGRNPDSIGDKVAKTEELRNHIDELKEKQLDAMIYVLDLCKMVRDKNLRYGLLLQDIYINDMSLKDINMKTYGIASSKAEMMHHDALVLLAKLISSQRRKQADEN